MSNTPIKISTNRPPLSRRQRHVEGRRIARETRAELVARFPKAFRPAGESKVPLALGTLKAVLAATFPDLDPEHVRVAVRDYCTGFSYRKAIVEGADRIGLDGRSTGKVTKQEANYARALRDAVHDEMEREVTRIIGPFTDKVAAMLKRGERRPCELAALKAIRDIAGEPVGQPAEKFWPAITRALRRLPACPPSGRKTIGRAP